MLLILFAISCFTLFCCVDEGRSEEGGNSNPISGFSGSSDISAAGSPAPTSSNSGMSQPDTEAFFCGTTECTGLDDEAGLGRISELRAAFEYCCTPSNACSTRQVFETECPDPIVCGGEVCSPVLDTLSIGGTACCSPSGRCSVTMETLDGVVCPDPINTDPDCPDVDGWVKHFEQDSNFVNPGADMPNFDVSIFTSGGCCLPDNTCGLAVLNVCMGPVYSFVGLNGPVIDCDGNIVDSRNGGI